MLRNQIMTQAKALYFRSIDESLLSWVAFSFIVPNIEKRRDSNTQKRQSRKKQKSNSGIILIHGK